MNIAYRHAIFTPARSEEHTSELQSQSKLVCRLLLEKNILEAHAPAVDPPRHQQHLFLLDMHALDGTAAFGEHELLWLGERRQRAAAAAARPDPRRVHSLVDRVGARVERC